MAIQVVILAAGEGKRMYSSLPKVLHHLAGKPLLEHVIQTALRISTERAPIIIYGHAGHALRNALSQFSVQWIEQREQLGTAHALLQAMPHIKTADTVLVLYGDVPLITQTTLEQLIKATQADELGMLTAVLANPQGYGRIKRDANNKIIAIVEEKDTNDEERAMTEINPGIYYVSAAHLKKWLPMIQNKNAQKEFYLTDIVGLAKEEGVSIHSVKPQKEEEILGVNDRLQLAKLERFYQRQQADYWMRQGVTLCDPARLDIRGEVNIGHDVVIDVNVILAGRVEIGNHCLIGPNVTLRDVVIGDGVEVKANCVLEGADIATGCIVGPFARIRPGTKLMRSAHVGNFVEIKNSDIGEGSKVNHLSYIGDCSIGRSVNIGAGTITCNYDGVYKHKTKIGDYVQIGSDTQLIAPVNVGDGATIGAGSTITKDVPAEKLTLTQRLDQRTIQGWHRPMKEKSQ